MEYYYNITIVRATRGDAEDIPLMLKENLDCFDGDNRRKIVDYARGRNLLKTEDLKWIRDVENMNKADYDELVAHNTH